jgi:hypothetical protein
VVASAAVVDGVVTADELGAVEDATGLPASGVQAAVAATRAMAKPIIRMFMIVILDHETRRGQVT